MKKIKDAKDSLLSSFFKIKIKKMKLGFAFLPSKS